MPGCLDVSMPVMRSTSSFFVPTRRLLHLILKVSRRSPALLCSHQAIGRESVLRALVRHQCNILLLLHVYKLKHLARIHASFRLALSAALLFNQERQTFARQPSRRLKWAPLLVIIVS